MQKTSYVILIILCAAITLPQSYILVEETDISIDDDLLTEARTSGIREEGQMIKADSVLEGQPSQISDTPSEDADGDGYGDATTIKPGFSDSDLDSNNVIKDEVKKEV